MAGVERSDRSAHVPYTHVRRRAAGRRLPRQRRPRRRPPGREQARGGPPRPPAHSPGRELLMRSERWDTQEPIRLSLEVPSGDVRVETGDEPETTVVLEPAHDDDASVEAVEKARIEFRGGELSVIVPEQRTFGISFGRRGAVILRVRTPHGATASIKTKSADVVARGRYARAEVNSTSGDIEIGEVEGDAEFNTVSGDLRSGAIAGRADVNAVSGDSVLE